MSSNECFKKLTRFPRASLCSAARWRKNEIASTKVHWKIWFALSLSLPLLLNINLFDIIYFHKDLYEVFGALSADNSTMARVSWMKNRIYITDKTNNKGHIYIKSQEDFIQGSERINDVSIQDNIKSKQLSSLMNTSKWGSTKKRKH